MTGRRGRPRAYDPETALDAALEVFWAKGFSATSLEDLRRATGMNRPSLYAAFGDKAAIYHQVLARFRSRVREAAAPTLAEAGDLRASLTAYYLAILSEYTPAVDGSGGTAGRGCLVLGTAPVEAVGHPGVRGELAGALAEIDAGLASWFGRAKQRGALPPDADADQLAWLAASVHHSLSLRSRAGESHQALSALAAAAADLVVTAAGG